MKVWILTREFDAERSDIQGVFETKEKAQAAKDGDPNPEPWYGVLTITDWDVE